MHQPVHPLRRAALAASVLLLTCAAQAQTTLPAPAAEPASAMAGDQNTPAPIARQQKAEIARGDPARWHQEDVTPAQQMRTMRKEIAAGLQENLGACKAQPAAQRSACVREARAIHQQEMAGLGRAK